MTDIQTPGSKLVNNAILTIVARLAMIVAAGSLPIAGWMVQRGVNTIDDVSKKIDTMRDQALETNGTVKLIQQTQGIQTQIIADHELRVRTLESISRNGLPPTRNN